uniref:Heat shock protein 70 n=1 Tax=Haptolina brevifila TaxID=156173 RepID=A0A7S2C2W0_9EUKA|mmetsp:Transcript_1970/g.4013  ORF Transcript_1970/g.4013 Transcript_1970/m.4013 type:complete len:457 (+) Transcript_1970:88-1458(+)
MGGGMDSQSECFIFFGLIMVLLAAAVQQMMPSPPATCVGIDLGTTFSCVAVYDDGEITVINNRGKSITPSVLFQPPDDGNLIVGEGARAAAAATLGGTLIYDAKRFIGKPYVHETVLREARGLPFEVVPGLSTVRDQLEPHLQFEAGGQRIRLSPEDVGTLVVHNLKLAAEELIGRSVENAVLAVPVGFNRKQINATKQAAVNAGFNVLRTIHEPTAAAMAYGLHTRPQVNTVMVYDIGGGTLDVSLLDLSNGIFTVMAAAGDNRLGGQDFNLVLLEHLVEVVGARMPDGSPPLTSDPEAMRALREEAERIKIELNDEADCSGRFDSDDPAETEVRLPASLAAAGPLTVDRAVFERLAAPLLERALRPVHEVLKKVEMRQEDVDELVLVGGSSRMARIRQLLRDHFGDREPNCDVSPEEAVAHGTAIQAAILTDRKKISVGATEAALHTHLEGVER